MIEALSLYGLVPLCSLIIVWSMDLQDNQELLIKDQKKNFDLIIGFYSMLHGGLVIFVFISAINKLGVQTASFVAVIGAAGLAVGLALQGSPRTLQRVSCSFYSNHLK